MASCLQNSCSIIAKDFYILELLPAVNVDIMQKIKYFYLSICLSMPVKGTERSYSSISGLGGVNSCAFRK